MRRTFLLLVVVTAMLTACAGVVLAQQPTRHGPSQSSSGKDFVAGELLVKFQAGTSEAEKEKAIKDKNDQKKETISGLDVDVVSVKSGTEKAKLDEYKADPHVKYAEPNGRYFESQTTTSTSKNDPRLKDQWGFNNIGQNSGTSGADIRSFNAWNAPHTTNQIAVAVLDGGIKSSHEDLQQLDGTSKVTLSKDFSGSGSTDDGTGHGTHVAGTIAATTNNAKGGAGACGDWDKCVLVNGKVLDNTGSGTDVTVANGILWVSGCETTDSTTGNCTGNGGSGTPRAKVINMSFGGSGTTTMRNAVDKAWSNGVVLVAAAGNSGTQSPSAPALYEHVIAVAATDNNDQKASYSNYGSGTLANGFTWDVDVAAPGSNILSTTKDGAYGYMSGTSMATPHVSGTAALVWFNATLGTTNQQIRDKIESTADQIAGTGSYWTKGRIDACRALDLDATSCGSPSPPTSDKTPPIVASTSPGNNATGLPRATNVTATFSEAMKASTITTSTFKLVDQSTGTKVSATLSCDSPCKTAKLTPSQLLAANKQYKAVVTTGAQDLASNAMTQNMVWYLTTGSN